MVVELLEDRCVPSRLFLTAGASGGPPNTIINVPVNFSDATGGLGSGDINITYDDSRLSIPSDISFTGNTSSSTLIDGITSTAGLFIGEVISGPGIPLNDTIATVGTGNITLTTAATSTGTSRSFTASSILHGAGTVTGTGGGSGAFTNFTPTLLDSTGQLHVSFSDTKGANPWPGTQVLFSINFKVQSNAPMGSALVNLQYAGIMNGQAQAASTKLFQTDTANTPYTLSPAVDDSSNDVTITVSPTTLYVTTFAATSTGFQAVFNRAIAVGTPSAPVLNLYDNSSGTMGPADVTLVGAATGPIRGSLVIDQNNTRITFIQTGQTGVLGSAVSTTLFGVLPNDTYTVTLRSASNGFQDTSGSLLDGNADGTPDDNYVTTFVVSNPAKSITVSLPDFARGPGQPVNLPTATTASGIPLRFLNNASTAVTLTSVTLSLAYDSTLLAITGAGLATGLPAGATVTVNTSTPGLALVSFSSATGVVLSGKTAAVFLDLTATVPSTANYASKEILDLQNININNDTFTTGNSNSPAIDDAAIHVSAFLGDATRDLTYTGLDAQRIARASVGLDPGFRQWLLADPLIVGDVNGDNVLTGLDALIVARQAVGITQSVIPSLPAVTPAIVGPDPLLSIPTTFSTTAGSTLQVPVNLDHPNGLDAVDLAISYDTSRLDVASTADVLRGSLTETFDSFTVNLDRAAGIICISGYRTAGPLGGFAGGSVAVIDFTVRDNAPAGPAIINLMQNVGTTWSLLGGTDAQGNDFLFDLQPRPSNAAGDPLDGVINVTPAVLHAPSLVPPATPASINTIIPEAPALVAEPAADAVPRVNANAVPRTGDGVPTILSISDGRTTVPALLLPASQYGLQILGARLDEDLFSVLGTECKVNEQEQDDFFSQYPAIVQNGSVGSEQGLLAEKNQAGPITAETAARG